MLKQVFDKEQLSKVLTSSDVWQWSLLSDYGNVEVAVDHTVQYWKSNDLTLNPLNARVVKDKTVFIPSKMEDALAIKVLDRFIRRIYKVRQSDRNRIVRQIITLLRDSGNYHILRLDIKDCYESIQFKQLINKFENELILAPGCIRLLEYINKDLHMNHDVEGLPRGVSVSPTLAELYLEAVDEKLASLPDVIYSARYVDDIIVITPTGKECDVKSDIEALMNEMGLNLNYSPGKYYSGPTSTSEFNYLGYFIKVERQRNKPNKVTVKISESKLDILKARIVLSFCDYKNQKNIQLLKRRLEYLCMLKSVRQGKNGDLLAGIAHNYRYVNDDFECLKKIDGFLCHQLTSSRFGLSQQDQNKIKKISIYGNTRKKNVGRFSKKQTARIMRVWNNA